MLNEIRGRHFVAPVGEKRQENGSEVGQVQGQQGQQGPPVREGRMPSAGTAPVSQQQGSKNKQGGRPRQKRPTFQC